MRDFKWSTPGTDMFSNMTRGKESLEKKYYQVRVIFNNVLKFGKIKKTTFNMPFEFASPQICFRREDAVAYAPFYIDTLVKNGDLPKEIYTDKNELNEQLVRVYIQELELTVVEKDVTDK